MKFECKQKKIISFTAIGCGLLSLAITFGMPKDKAEKKSIPSEVTQELQKEAKLLSTPKAVPRAAAIKYSPFLTKLIELLDYENSLNFKFTEKTDTSSKLSNNNGKIDSGEHVSVTVNSISLLENETWPQGLKKITFISTDPNLKFQDDGSFKFDAGTNTFKKAASAYILPNTQQPHEFSFNMKLEFEAESYTLTSIMFSSDTPPKLKIAKDDIHTFEPKKYDLDEDGREEFVVQKGNQIHVFNYIAGEVNPLPGWPRNAFAEKADSHLIIGEFIEENKGLEIVAITYNTYKEGETSFKGYLFTSYSFSGEILATQKLSNFSTLNRWEISDINDDGINEIIIGGRYGYRHAYIHALNGYGKAYNSLSRPSKGPDRWTQGWPRVFKIKRYGKMTWEVADLDQDGQQEVAVALTSVKKSGRKPFQVFLIEGVGGSDMKGWTDKKLALDFKSLEIKDMNNDGKLDMIFNHNDPQITRIFKVNGDPLIIKKD